MTPGAPPGTARTSNQPTDRVAIPWSTVLGYAGVLAVADWFWVISLRGAVGAIERTDGPFLAWLQGSVLLTPLFAFAVLGALAIAYRRFGPELHRTGTVLATGLLIVTACTLAGLGTLIVSGAYDYQLQLGKLDHLAVMGVPCNESCVTAQRDATLALQLKALGVGTSLLLATNLLLVGWMVAIRGGRLTISRSRPATRSGGGSRVGHRAAGWGGEVELVLVAALVGTGTILAVHATADLLYALSAAAVLLLAALAHLGSARLATVRPGRTAWVVAAVLAVGLPGAWVYAHSAGNPLAAVLGSPGRVGLAEGASGVLELATLAAALLLLGAPA